MAKKCQKLEYKNITKDSDPLLRLKSLDVETPLSSQDENTLIMMNNYLSYGYDEEYCKTHDIRPGVGIAAPQVGLSKKMICIMAYDEKGEFYNLGIINPKIISHSEELTYLPSGEGCLSVIQEYKGYVHRPKKVKFSSYIYDFMTGELSWKIIQLKGFMSVVFQHEYDHLFGKLFYDHINKNDPYFIPDNSSPISFK